MGREASSPPPPPPPPAVVHGAGSSLSGQKRKAAMDDGSGEDDNVPPWLKLSLGPVAYGVATGVVDDDSSSCAPAVTTSIEVRPPVATGVVSGSAAQPSIEHVPADDAVVTPSFVASAAGVLFTGCASGLIPNGAVSVFPCFNFLGPSMSSSILSHLHQQFSSTRRQSNASMARSSRTCGGDDDMALSNIAAPNVTNGGGNNNNDGNALPDPPYPWATNEPAKHHSLAELARRDITTIQGDARCRRCDARKVIVYNIATKFQEVSDYLRQNHQHMHDRAQARWMNPVVPNCDDCGHEKCLRPVIAAEKERINWLFLLLGETLGLCTLDQLKYFCAHTNRHRTGAKDRVLFSTYEELCNQLVPGLITRRDQLRMR
ncbi:hypothetical protein OsJ_35673 [Oryza sativa Japonica Group]|uniref:DUF7086 domain-containing protein n=1 Tax=Oryza sativa subsp. japonica TaxID=39947 RepID=B9GCI7_ORYSJ|nr:uncharacterized protein LOC4351852 [Oryza sativa Japonica Group]EEE52994.1 hypothetical protein OsJ_35673 [Oryza sativa Japonica Group]